MLQKLEKNWQRNEWWFGKSPKEMEATRATARNQLEEVLNHHKSSENLRSNTCTANTPTVILTSANSVHFLATAIEVIRLRWNLILGSQEWEKNEFSTIREWLTGPVFIQTDTGSNEVDIVPLNIASPVGGHAVEHDSDVQQDRSKSHRKSSTGEDHSDERYPSPWIALATGGSSGKFKLAVHTVETLSQSAFGFQKFIAKQTEKKLPVINSFLTLPLYHISGWMTVWRAWLTGGKICETIKEENGISVMENLLQGNRSLPTSSENNLPLDYAHWMISLVPTQLYRELNQEQSHAQSRIPYSQLRAILIGGAPLTPELSTLAQQKKWPLVPTYGMTETAALTCALPSSEFLKGVPGYGQALPHANILIEREQEEDSSGNIRIVSSSLFLGYLGESPRSEDYFEPRDLGYWNDQNSLVIVGRTDNVIITGGKKVSPERIEQTLRTHPDIEEVVVLGLQDPEWGQRVVMVIENNPAPSSEKVNLTLSGIQTWLKQRLPGWQIPKSLYTLPQFPRTPTGKLQRSDIVLLIQHLKASDSISNKRF